MGDKRNAYTTSVVKLEGMKLLCRSRLELEDNSKLS
jgi:hypothetical protein